MKKQIEELQKMLKQETENSNHIITFKPFVAIKTKTGHLISVESYKNSLSEEDKQFLLNEGFQLGSGQSADYYVLKKEIK